MPGQEKTPRTMLCAPVLVAGGAGFLGAHLCRRLLDMGCAVFCLDNLDTGSWEAVEALRAYPRFSWIRHDVVDPIPFDGPLGRIYNLACPASPRHYQADPPHTLLTCVDGARNLLDLARRTGARILQASTSEVYGDPLEHPQHESYRGNVNIVGLRSCYDEGKRCAETLFSDYGARYGVHTKIARIFNTYGPGMALDDGRLVSNLIVQALKGYSMTLYGDGSQTRSLCYVDDLIDGLIRLMESQPSFRGPVNLGNPHETTVQDVADVIRELTGTTAPLVRLALPPDDPKRRCPDIVLAQRHLDWRPTVGLREGLRRTITDFSGRLGGP
ncbi:MAG TPA: UDP-glucuronic acid decarboxylase family protein [Castellaniella sp.]|jgi:UDP-glucuronate decarboxylase|nr:UDP-glucuronic acid decarboxylase family protein [Castellaniella sp.]